MGINIFPISYPLFSVPYSLPHCACITSIHIYIYIYIYIQVYIVPRLPSARGGSHGVPGPQQKVPATFHHFSLVKCNIILSMLHFTSKKW